MSASRSAVVRFFRLALVYLSIATSGIASAAGSVWVATGDRLEEHDAISGTLKRALILPAPAQAVATDAGNSLEWVSFAKGLRAYSSQGDLRREVDLDNLTPAQGSLAVDGRGTVWFVAANGIYRVDTYGNLLGDPLRRPGKNPSELRYDNARKTVWALYGADLIGYDEEGAVAAQLTLGTNREITAFDVSPQSVIWAAVATPHNALVRFDADLNPQEFTVPPQAGQIQSVAIGGEMAIWTGSQQNLYHLNVPAATTGVVWSADKSGPGPLALAKVDQTSVWVALAKGMQRIGEDGTVLASIALPDGVADMASASDTTPPTVTITSPGDDDYVGTRRPSIGVEYADPESGVNTDSLHLAANGASLPATVTAWASEAIGYPTQDLLEGANTLTASVADNAGNVGTSKPVTVIVDTIPPPIPNSGTIAVTLAGNIATVTGTPGSVEPGAMVTITDLTTGVSVTVQADGQGAFQGVLTVVPGDRLSIVAADRVGNRSAALQLSTGTPLTLTITAPANGAALTRNEVRVVGDFEGPLNTAVTVNGVPALVYGGHFVADNVPLTAGANTLVVTAKALDGREVSQTRTITSGSVTSVLALRAAPASGVIPWQARFSIDYAAQQDPIVSYAFDADGNGSSEIQQSGSLTDLTWDYATAGFQFPKVTVTTQSGKVYQAQTTALAQDEQVMDQLFHEVWDGLLAAMRLGNVDAALQFFDDGARDQYGPVLAALAPHLPEIANDLANPIPSKWMSEIGEYAVIQASGTNGDVHFIYFYQQTTGIWAIDSM